MMPVRRSQNWLPSIFNDFFDNELLLKLINDILDLSKLESGSVELKYEEFDLAEYFDSSLRRIFDGISYIISHHLCNPIFVKSHPAHTIRIHRDQLHFRICHPLLH